MLKESVLQYIQTTWKTKILKHDSKSTKQVVKEIAVNERTLELACDRCLYTDTILKNDLVHSITLLRWDHDKI